MHFANDGRHLGGMGFKIIAFQFSLHDVCRRRGIFTKHTDGTQLCKGLAFCLKYTVNLLETNFLERKTARPLNYASFDITLVSHHQRQIFYATSPRTSTQCQKLYLTRGQYIAVLGRRTCNGR